MAMAWIFTAMIVISVVFGMVNGTMDAVSAAALSGANDAITLTISLLGVLCLWSGVLEVMDQSGLSNKLAAIFRPLLRKIFPDASADLSLIHILYYTQKVKESQSQMRANERAGGMALP